MHRSGFVAALLLAVLPAQEQPREDSGQVTIADATANAFNFPSPLLTAEQRRAFAVGNSLFRTNWVTASASAQGVDGLGPLFNARSCSSCHLHDGRSRPPEPDEAQRHGLLVRIGVRTATGPDAPHPTYGDQVQDDAIPGVQREARVGLTWQTTRGEYGDGEPFELIAPRYELLEPAYGAPAPAAQSVVPDSAVPDDVAPGAVVLGGRTAPQLIGLGLLEAIPAAALRAHADPSDRDGDGISGRVHELPSGAVGRFGWKATQPTVHAQTAAAFVNDMGITSSVHPHEALTGPQRAAITAPSGGEPEIDDHKLERIVFYARTLAVPARRARGETAVVAGEALFTSFGCASCHVPEWTTGDDAPVPALARRTLQPYTDLLLHDLGPELADGKHDCDASPGEWRTPPLWGIGLIQLVNGHERLLHDGRARGVAEAILWHGGEAAAARDRFRTAAAAQRAELVAFVRSL